LRDGVAEIGLRPDPDRAVDYLHHAATFFGDKEAQFELAKVYLRGTAEDVKCGMHYLSALTEEGYPRRPGLSGRPLLARALCEEG
jgi:hypothetical protein